MTFDDTDYGYGLVLCFAFGDYSVHLEDDPSMGASLTFAHCQGFLDGNNNETYELDNVQQAQVDRWFEEYEA